MPAPTNEYSWDFAMGPGAWASWFAPSVVQDPGGAVAAFTRFHAPGIVDSNHIDGIGSLFLLAHLSIPTIGSAGVLNLADAEFEITIKGTDFQANGGKLMVWVCRYIPEEGVLRNYYVGLQVTNWANTGNDLASQLTDDWQTLTVQLSDDPADWTYAGNAVSIQGDWADRYQPLDLASSLDMVNATLHLVMVADESDEGPTGFLDIANITVRTQTPATPVGVQTLGYQLFHGLEDQDAAGVLAGDAGVDPSLASYQLVAGSATNGTVVIDPATGAFTFTPNTNFYGPTDFVGAATFRYTVTDGTHTSAVKTVVVFIGPINDAPVTSTADVTMELTHNQPFAYTIFGATDVDKERLTYRLVDGSAQHGTVAIDPDSGRYVFTPEAGYVGAASFQYVASDGQRDSPPATITLNVHAAGDDPVLPTFQQVIDTYLLAGDPQGFYRYVVLLADAGDVNAAYHYGTWLHTGVHVARDIALSAHYLALAAATVPDAALQLADMYLAGDGVPRDPVMARLMLELHPSSATAIYRIAILDDLGYGAPQDHARAVEGFLEAAKLGNADAMYTLGRRYLMAEGVAFSAADAYFWLGVALKYDGGPLFPAGVNQFDNLLIFNQQEAVSQAGLTPTQVAALDALIDGWTIGQPSPVNDAPVAGTDSDGAGQAGAPVSGTLAPASDADGDALTYLVAPGSVEHGVVVIDPRTGVWTFTPDPDYHGSASFRYVVSDGQATSAEQTVNITLAPVTNAVDDVAVLDEAATLTTDAAQGLLTNDAVSAIGTTLSITAVAGQGVNVGQAVAGAYGSITINADGGYTYVADPSTVTLLQGQTHVETFTYTITDANGVSDTATLHLTINGVSGTIISGDGTLQGSAFDDVITGGAGHDVLLGLAGDDRLTGGVGALNEMFGGTGDDTYVVSNNGDTIVENANEGLDTVETALSSFNQRNHVENLTYTGSGNFIGSGNALNNVIRGGVGSDTLIGNGGNDILIGGTGAANTLLGGAGDDTYVVSNAGDSYIESANDGTDLVLTELSSLTLRVNVEDLTYIGSGNFSGIGNASANTLTGGDGDDILDGADGADTLVGGLGDDIYEVDSVADGVVEAEDGGTDLVRATASLFVLSENVENLTFTGTGAFAGYGNDLANIIRGGDDADTLRGYGGDDILHGGLGDNVLIGGQGDDLYVVSDWNNVLHEDEDEGYDTVRVEIGAFTLFSNIEALIYTGSGDFHGVGNASGNLIVGGVGNDLLDGGYGADLLVGGLGDDVYLIDDGLDVVQEGAGEGVDEVWTTLDTYTLGLDLEGLVYVGYGDFIGIGNAADNGLQGGDGDDHLDGLAGADRMDGGWGDDTYGVDDAGDVIIDADGWDVVGTTLTTFTLQNDLEGLVFTGTGAFSGTGNGGDNDLTGAAGDDVLVGLDGDDWLDGGAGADVLDGGWGDDLYFIDNPGDQIIDAGGWDAVETTLSIYTLAVGLEDLFYSGTGGFTGTGNALNNEMFAGDGADRMDGLDGDDLLVGGAGDDILNGGAGNDLLSGDPGADLMTGGDGDDLYTVDDAGDQVVEEADGGFDGVQTSLSVYTLTAQVEAVFYTGSDSFTGVGNGQDNILSGGDGDDDLSGAGGNDALFGGWGADTLRGGLGDDTYIVEDETDLVIEREDEGVDQVVTSLNVYSLGDHLEQLVFLGSGDFSGIGNDLDNLILGGDGNDMLYGGLGTDVLQGGLGDDLYIVDGQDDVVNEGLGEGFDTIELTGALNAYGLGANIEGLRVNTGVDFALTGNALGNVLTSLGTGSDVLDGGAGADTLSGGRGDDTYLVDDAGDMIIEATGQGYDTVRATAALYALSAGIEALVFVGTGAFHGIGNASANTLTGGQGADTLDGDLGDDVLIGGAGNDSLNGGDGIDRVDYSAAGSGVTVRLDVNRTTNDGEGGSDTLSSIENADGSAFNDVIFGSAAANVLRGGLGRDTLLGLGGDDVMIGGDVVANTLQGGLGDDRYIVTAVGDTVYEVAGEGTDTVETTLNTFTLSANVETLVFTGSGVFTGTGNASDNVITGGAANDLLGGGVGADTLNGGDGDDVLRGGAGLDVLNGGAGYDTLDYSLAAAATVVRMDLNRTTNDGDGSQDSFTGIETVIGSAFNDVIFGNTAGNVIVGGAGSDIVLGLGGDDTLIGGSGAANTLQGGLGDDHYVVDANDTIIEAAGEGVDTVETTLYSFVLAANVENLIFTGTGVFYAIGNSSANTIRGGTSNDQLDGAGGDDILWGGAASDLLIGGAGSDTLYGEAGNDILNGGAGDDILTGGLGDDRYMMDSLGDRIIELAGQGVDTVETTLSTWTLALGLENLIYAGTAAFTGLGNAADNVITGGIGDDTLIAGLGNDTFNGGGGFDTIDYSAVGAAITVKLNGAVAQNDGQGGVDVLTGIERVIGTAFDDLLVGDGLGNTLIGGAGRDTLLGLNGDDLLVGGEGVANTLQGGTGNDRYIVSVAGDSVVELVGEGIDTVETALSAWTLGANVENLIHTGAIGFTGTGNALANVITGGSGADLLRGGGGNDTLTGGLDEDIALFSGLRTAYTIVATADGYRITDNDATADGDDGTDLLLGIEQVRFRDGATLTLSDLGLTAQAAVSGKDAPVPEASSMSATAVFAADPLILPGAPDDFLFMPKDAGAPLVLPDRLDGGLILTLASGHADLWGLFMEPDPLIIHQQGHGLYLLPSDDFA